MSTCLMTGGAGFIGCAISSSLVTSFDRVIAIDNLHPQIHIDRSRPALLDKAVALVVADITQPQAWDELLASDRPDVVIHLAAETGTGQSLTEASRHAMVNVVGTTQMLDAFVRHDAIPHRIVLSSSRAVYGEGAWRDENGAMLYPGQRSRAMLENQCWDFPGLTCLPFEATRMDPRPTSVYGATKLTQEQILNAWALSFNVQVNTLRLQNVYGPGQSLTNAYTGIVSLFAQLARKGQTIPIYEDGQIIRDFVFIEDVAKAITLVATKELPPALPYDIGSGEGTSILELGRMIAARYGAPEPSINGKFRNGDVRHASCTIERSQSELGWTPKWRLPDGLETLCSWIDDRLK